MRRTGGGPPPLPPPGSGDTTDWLRSIIPTSVDGNKSIYDDDVIIETPVFPEKKLISFEVVDEVTSEEILLPKKVPADDTSPEVNEAATTQEVLEFDTSTPYSSLKRPVSSPLKRRAKKNRTAENGNLVRQMLREKKLAILDNLQELELQKIKESISHAQEIHVQALRHNEERHKLDLRKASLRYSNIKKKLRFLG